MLKLKCFVQYVRMKWTKKIRRSGAISFGNTKSVVFVLARGSPNENLGDFLVLFAYFFSLNLKWEWRISYSSHERTNFRVSIVRATENQTVKWLRWYKYYSDFIYFMRKVSKFLTLCLIKFKNLKINSVFCICF